MIKDSFVVDVYNMSNEIVTYKLDEEKIRRRFDPFEVKKISAGELRRLFYIPGGAELLQNYLCVRDDELAQEFGVPEDMVEYNWTIEDIDRVLLKGSEDELADALEFGPIGIKNVIQDRAIALKIKNLDKRQLINDYLDVNITSMIDFLEADNDTQEQTDSTSHGRRVKR